MKIFMLLAFKIRCLTGCIILGFTTCDYLFLQISVEVLLPTSIYVRVKNFVLTWLISIFFFLVAKRFVYIFVGIFVIFKIITSFKCDFITGLKLNLYFIVAKSELNSISIVFIHLSALMVLLILNWFYCITNYLEAFIKVYHFFNSL